MDPVGREWAQLAAAPAPDVVEPDEPLLDVDDPLDAPSDEDDEDEEEAVSEVPPELLELPERLSVR